MARKKRDWKFIYGKVWVGVAVLSYFNHGWFFTRKYQFGIMKTDESVKNVQWQRGRNAK